MIHSVIMYPVCLQLRGKNGGDKKRPDPVALLAGRLEQQLMNCQGDQVYGKASLPQIISPLIPTSAGNFIPFEMEICSCIHSIRSYVCPTVIVCLSIYLSDRPSVCLSIYTSVYQSVHRSICLSVCLPVCRSIYLSTY